MAKSGRRTRYNALEVVERAQIPPKGVERAREPNPCVCGGDSGRAYPPFRSPPPMPSTPKPPPKTMQLSSFIHPKNMHRIT